MILASINLQGDTSGSISISAPSVAGSNTLTLPATTQTLATQNALGVRNLIINGDMRIAQRGTSASGITGDGYYTVDRFYVVNISAGTWTQTQDTDVPTGQGFSNSLKMQCTTADASLSASDQIRIEQRIEAQNLQHLKFGTSSAESITLSFWVKSNKTGTYTVWLYAIDDARSISKTYTINTADTWEKKTITIEGDSVAVIDNDNGIGLFCTFSLGAGSNFTSGTFNTSWNNHVTANMISPSQVNLADSTSNYINITGVQLEVGDTATPFEHRPYDMELDRCQRYYEKSFYMGTAPSNSFSEDGTSSGLGALVSFSGVNTRSTPFWFKVRKRAVPTLTIYNPGLIGTTGVYAAYIGSWTALTSNSPYSHETFWALSSSLSGASTGQSYIIAGGWAASAEL